MLKKKEQKKAILETYTKEYSAEYQAQALIDIAKKLNKKIAKLQKIGKPRLTKEVKIGRASCRERV